MQNNQVEQQRVRSFPHEAGNWATFIAIPVSQPTELNEFLEKLLLEFPTVSLTKVDDFHISLTRVLVLRHHWISGFIDSVREIVAGTTVFPITMQGLSVYLNDDKTRTFVAIEVKSGRNYLDHAVNQLDKCLSEYGLPKFYEDRSFHMSLLWGLGDLTHDLRNFIKQNKGFCDFVLPVSVKNCFCKTGNKLFSFEFSR